MSNNQLKESPESRYHREQQKQDADDRTEGSKLLDSIIDHSNASVQRGNKEPEGLFTWN
jgi:hypothetical protein